MGEEMKIDYREKAIISYWPKAEVCELPIGDIISDDGKFCIERKSDTDFLNSIMTHHIFNQSISMYDTYPGKCIILVEGDLKTLPQTAFFNKYRINAEGIRGAIASLYTKYHVPVLLASTRNGFVEMTNKILEKYYESLGGDELIFIEQPTCKARANPKLQILLQIPKIGKTKALKILAHYGEFSNINKMEKPKGVSQKELDIILEILK